MRKQDKMGGSDSRAPLRLGRSVVRPTKPPCYAGYIGGGGGGGSGEQEKQRDYITFLFKVPLRCMPASKVSFVLGDRFMHGPTGLRYWCIGQLPLETRSPLCRIALWD